MLITLNEDDKGNDDNDDDKYEALKMMRLQFKPEQTKSHRQAVCVYDDDDDVMMTKTMMMTDTKDFSLNLNPTGTCLCS